MALTCTNATNAVPQIPWSLVRALGVEPTDLNANRSGRVPGGRIAL
jgi:hypothetical protein